MRAVSGIHTSSTFQPSVLSGPCPYGEKATGITAQVRAGPARSSTEAVTEKPAKSQPTPGKPSSAIGSSYPASAAGLRPRTRRGIRPVNASGASMIAFAPASRCRAVIRQALTAYEREACQHGKRGRDEDKRRPGLQPGHGIVEGRAARHVVSLDDRHLDSHPVVRGYSERDACERHPLGANDRLPPEARQEGQREPDEHREQPAEHVQLRVEVDDHRTRIAAPVEEVVNRWERLDRPL